MRTSLIAAQGLERRETLLTTRSNTALDPEQFQDAYGLDVEDAAQDFFLPPLYIIQEGDQTFDADDVFSFLSRRFKGAKCVLKWGDRACLQIQGEDVILSWKTCNDLLKHVHSKREVERMMGSVL